MRRSIVRIARLAGLARGSTENPHISAGKRLHNDRYMDLALARQNWRIACFVLSLAVMVLSGSLAWLAAQSRVVPYVSVIDRNYKVISVGPARRVLRDEHLMQSLTQAAVVDFITNARSITPDPIAQVSLMQRVWAYAAPDSRQMLSDYYAANDPGAAAREGRRVSVEIEAVILRSDRIWEVRWGETDWDPKGIPHGEERWEARLGVDRRPPRDAELALVNPLGLFVTGLSWSKRMQ